VPILIPGARRRQQAGPVVTEIEIEIAAASPA
jgi:hypothetical protein